MGTSGTPKGGSLKINFMSVGQEWKPSAGPQGATKLEFLKMHLKPTGQEEKPPVRPARYLGLL